MKFQADKFSSKKEEDNFIYDGEPCNYDWMIKTFGDCYEICKLNTCIKIWRYDRNDKPIESFIFTDDAINNVLKEEFGNLILDFSMFNFQPKSYLISVHEMEKYNYKVFPTKLLKEMFPKWREALNYSNELSKYLNRNRGD